MNEGENNPKGFGRREIALIALGFLLIAGFVIWQIYNFRKAGAALSSPTFAQDQPDYALEIQRVSLADAKAAFDSQSAVFVDVRGADSYGAGHIPGAVNIPLVELEGRTGELDPNRWIITYCT